MKKDVDMYIIKRKLKAALESIVYYLCHVFPVQKKKIVVWTFEGEGGYTCSPKYIIDELRRQNRDSNDDYCVYWIVKDIRKEFPSDIIKIKDTLWNRAYHMSTAGVWISNSRSFLGTVKRKKTVYIQTWHGSISLKPIGKYRGDKFSDIACLVSKRDSMLMDCAISGSRWCTKMWPDGLLFDGNIIELGTPRCDVLINSVKEKHVQLREEYDLPINANIVLYAPTFRGGSQQKVRSVACKDMNIDFERLLAVFEKKMGGQWYFFLRLHPQLSAKMKAFPIMKNSSRIIDVSQRDDMAEIMAATDAIITDYSTIIFEGFLTGQPGFILADDLEEYVEDRGELMFDMDEIPFPSAKNIDELIRNIELFDEEDYKKKSILFIQKTGIIEDGNASKRVVEWIKERT